MKSLLLAHLRKVTRFIERKGLRQPHQNSQQIPLLMRETLESHDLGSRRSRPRECVKKQMLVVFVASLCYEPKIRKLWKTSAVDLTVDAVTWTLGEDECQEEARRIISMLKWLHRILWSQWNYFLNVYSKRGIQLVGNNYTFGSSQRSRCLSQKTSIVWREQREAFEPACLSASLVLK